ncbi:hypothetical protein CTAYLR_007484 [Chrysophaeum taylorii]|uniref:Uncharacterized protein n=1 Tax=Chrysophaeum taylorii TaxID=2483200 RepID=A0AAD7UDZ4_9STRA|nr:hypothetical protein CTAYLR_007484 [Chrysophaeum taylorii]
MFDRVDDDSSDSEERTRSFAEMGLPREILLGVSELGYAAPTPIQAKVIPLALERKDLCASAPTGSGKTAAFGIPLLANGSGVVLEPTRELASQCVEMLRKIGECSKSTTFCLVVGGSDLRAQEAQLRRRPDIVVGTPGRLLDVATNTHGVVLEGMLVLDEADRLLELGFEDQVRDLIGFVKRSQTLLFSATFGPRVEALASLSLRKPVVRVKVASRIRLTEDFVRITDPASREAALVAILGRTLAAEKTVVFFDTKKDCERVARVLRAMDVPAVELHGNLPQARRTANLKAFSAEKGLVLLATDVAARGLDVSAVKAVVNYEMPSVTTYVHRVGRTARAGRTGAAVTFVSEKRRLALKEYLRSRQAEADAGGPSSSDLRRRSVPASVIAELKEKINSKSEEIRTMEKDEFATRMAEDALRETERAANLIAFKDEIESRPKRAAWWKTTTTAATKEEKKRADALPPKVRKRKKRDDDDDKDAPLVAEPSRKTSFEPVDDDDDHQKNDRRLKSSATSFTEFDPSRVNRRRRKKKRSQIEFKGSFKTKKRYKRRR